jgi:hypothetical protein
LHTVPFKNAFELAQAIHRQMRTDNQSYSMKVKAYENPTVSLCWIGPPKVQWPAFAHGKYCFYNEVISNQNAIFCGIHVEKGFGPEMGKGQQETFDSTWTWNKLLRYASDGTLNQLINKMEQFSGHVFASIEVSADDKRDKFIYMRKEGTVKTKLLNEYGFIDSLQHIDTIEGALQQVNTSPFHWIDCFLGFFVKYNREPTTSEIDIWTNGLSPFDRFVE